MRASTVPDDCVITLSAADVSKTFNRSTFTRSQGQTDYQDVYSENVLANWQVYFNLSLSESVIPTCFKQTTIVPVLENIKVTCQNYYQPLELTSVAMSALKVWSWLISTPLSQKP